ncbi:ABC-2 family transporter protein [Paenibacillus sp. P1XP2]|nr:ABC-2 family transporter protein [Paenibacillus sp. P1XP2]
MNMLKQKMTWLGAAIVLVVLVVFGAAMLGTVLGSKPNELPVALVVLDQPAELPNGESLSVGEMIRKKMMSDPALPFVWHVLNSEEEAREGLDKREYYGALVFPADLSSGMLTLASPSPNQPDVKIIVNEGMNAQASSALHCRCWGEVETNVPPYETSGRPAF